MIPHEPWRAEAACAGYPTDWWFPTPGKNVSRRALDICAGCPVQVECAEHARSFPEVYGVWGGKHIGQRRRWV